MIQGGVISSAPATLEEERAGPERWCNHLCFLSWSWDLLTALGLAFVSSVGLLVTGIHLLWLSSVEHSSQSWEAIELQADVLGQPSSLPVFLSPTLPCHSTLTVHCWLHTPTPSMGTLRTISETESFLKFHNTSKVTINGPKLLSGQGRCATPIWGLWGRQVTGALSIHSCQEGAHLHFPNGRVPGIFLIGLHDNFKSSNSIYCLFMFSRQQKYFTLKVAWPFLTPELLLMPSLPLINISASPACVGTIIAIFTVDN